MLKYHLREWYVRGKAAEDKEIPFFHQTLINSLSQPGPILTLGKQQGCVHGGEEEQACSTDLEV